MSIVNRVSSLERRWQAPRVDPRFPPLDDYLGWARLWYRFLTEVERPAGARYASEALAGVDIERAIADLAAADQAGSQEAALAAMTANRLGTQVSIIEAKASTSRPWP